MNNMPVYDYDDAIRYIYERSSVGIDEDIIEEVLSLEEDYMRSIGILSEVEWNGTFKL